MDYLPPHPPSAKDLAEDAKKTAEHAKYTKLADKDTVEKTTKALETHGVKVTLAANKEEALKIVKESIPAGASVFHTASTTLWEIGWEDYIRGDDHGLVNINKKIRAENDQAKRQALRFKEAAIADYVLTSVDAITHDGQIHLVDSSTTRTGPFATAAHVVVVAGTHKIVPTIEDARKRVDEYSEPIERARLQKLYGPHLPSTWGYTTSFTIRNEFILPQRVHVVLVPESIGH